MRQNNIEKFQRCKINTHLNGNGDGKASPIIIISDKKKLLFHAHIEKTA